MLSYDTLAFILLITIRLFSSWIASFTVSDLKEIQNSLLIVGLAFVVFLVSPLKKSTFSSLRHKSFIIDETKKDETKPLQKFL